MDSNQTKILIRLHIKINYCHAIGANDRVIEKEIWARKIGAEAEEAQEIGGRLELRIGS